MKRNSMRCHWLMFVAALSFCAAYADGKSFVWLEDPTATNFPAKMNWDTLSGKSAPAVTNAQAGKNDPLFIEYQFDVPSPGGPMTLWGRAYDPKWSSPARWKVDGEEWRSWDPGAASDRQIFNKTFVMEWRSWGKVNLSPGKHSIRIELQGNRPRGDIPYFVLDALLLVRGDHFKPAGVMKPSDLIARQQALADAKIQNLSRNQDAFFTRSKSVANKAAEENLDALNEFDVLIADVDRALEQQELIGKNRQGPLHGEVFSGKLEGRQIKLETRWNRAFAGPLWCGFEQDGALYESSVVTLPTSDKHDILLNVPENIPAGRVTVRCVPIDQPLIRSATWSFLVGSDMAAKKPYARAWGIYRDANLRAHPWHVNDTGMMIWDGQPFVPMGGMINARSTWGTKAGEKDDFQAARAGVDTLRKRLALLKQYGLRDIFFNAFFLKSNPNALAEMINAAEEADMRYGLHVSSVPAHRSKGFATRIRNVKNRVAVPAQAKSSHFQMELAESELRTPHRCLWYVLNNSGQVIEQGVGVLNVQSVKSDKPNASKTPMVALSMDVSLSAEINGECTAVFYPELVMSGSEPSGYLDGIHDFITNMHEVYGGLKYGPGMRLWLDPFQNEMHANFHSLCTAPAFRNGFEQWLVSKAADMNELNRRWGIQGAAIESRQIAARLVPLTDNDKSIYLMDPETQKLYAGDSSRSQALKDLADYRGQLCEQLISRVSDELKSIANVPVVLKHNLWFSDWFVNPRKTGGFDGVGYEAYCYGDSLAFHNSLVPYAEALNSERRQWSLVTETSPAAFDGQKNYVGYIDRMQLLHDFDYMAMLGGKGIYTFGFSFDPPSNLQVTELIRDTRQLEWMATYNKLLQAALPRLAGYRPEVYGWYPAYLRERELTSLPPRLYEMDGTYLGAGTQIRMAPDGRWIVPALRPDADWFGLFTAVDLLTPDQLQNLKRISTPFPQWRLGGSHESLNGFTAQGIGLVSASSRGMTLDEFRARVLGYRVFQTADINGMAMPDGKLMIWTCIEKSEATVNVPSGISAVNLRGEPIALKSGEAGNASLHLVRPAYEKTTQNVPAYLGYGYYYPDRGQPEVAILSGVGVDQLLAANRPAWHRWLPANIQSSNVIAWQEAEDVRSTTFTMPRIEGYGSYSGGVGIGINTHFMPPKGQYYAATYDINASRPSRKLWIRRMSAPAMDLDVWVDGRVAGRVAANAKSTDSVDLNPWNAGTGKNKISVGWHEIDLGRELPSGKHVIEIRAVASAGDAGEIDTKLLGGQAEKELSGLLSNKGLMCVQIDSLMLTD